MSVNHQRYVAHFDMLGMRCLSLDKPEVAWSTLCKLSKAKEESLSKAIELTSTKSIIRDRIRSITFSDTIIIYSKSDEIEDLYAITTLCTQLFGDALKYSIPLRGGFAHGIFFTNLEHSLYAGPALVNAYTLGECAQWLGIVVDDVVAERCRKIPLQREAKDLFINWQLPLKCGHRSPMNVINWPLSLRGALQQDHLTLSRTFMRPLLNSLVHIPIWVKTKRKSIRTQLSLSIIVLLETSTAILLLDSGEIVHPLSP